MMNVLKNGGRFKKVQQKKIESRFDPPHKQTTIV